MIRNDHTYTNFSLLTYPYFGSDYFSLKGWQHGWVHINCQSWLSFPLMSKYWEISLVSCQSSLFDSMCLNTGQLHNHNYITICFKQISFNSARKFVTNFCYTSVYKQKHVDMLLIGQQSLMSLKLITTPVQCNINQNKI